MPPKRSSHRPPLPVRPTTVAAQPGNNTEVVGSGTTGVVSRVDRGMEARLKKVDKTVKECRKKVDRITEQQRFQYRFLTGALCEIVPGAYHAPATKLVITTLCSTHKDATESHDAKCMLKLEKRRDDLSVFILENTGCTSSEKEHALREIETYSTDVLGRLPPPLNTDDNQFKVRHDMALARSRRFCDLPPLTPDQRANATSHIVPKTLPAIYFHHINTSLEEPHLAEVHLKKAADLVPGCHIAWRLLGLLLSQPGPSSKATLAERCVEDLAPLSYFAKVVELLPKDVSTWWVLARSLHSLEEECVGDEELRLQIFVTINGKKYSSWDCFARVLELEPNVPKFWFYLGQSLLRRHHPFAKEECVVNIAFEGGPTMTEVTARYCYEAYIRISPDATTKMNLWFELSHVMLDGREVTADVDDAFSTIEVDNGATTLTRPGVLARMVAAEPTDPQTWRCLFRTLTAEPDSYHLPFSGMTIPGVIKDSMSVKDCLARTIEMNPSDAYNWIMMFDILYRRDTMQAALHKVCPHPDDNSTHNKAPPSTCVISGKTYTKIDCVLMAHQLTVILAEDKKVDESENHTDISSSFFAVSPYAVWICVAVLASKSKTQTFTLPRGLETLPLSRPLNSFNSKNELITVYDAIMESMFSKGKSCPDQCRLLELLLDESSELLNLAGLNTLITYIYEYCTQESFTCRCVHCCLVLATVYRVHEKYVVLKETDAYTTQLSANFKTFISQPDPLTKRIKLFNLKPEQWYDLGRVLQPGHKVTLFLNDSTRQEYTRIDCFKLAIESPKRWNRAAAWLALGHELKKDDTIVIYGKHHTRDDCFKQARMWFDEKPNAELKSQLTRRPPMDTFPHHLGLDKDDEGSELFTDEEGSEEESSDSTIHTDSTLDNHRSGESKKDADAQIAGLSLASEIITVEDNQHTGNAGDMHVTHDIVDAAGVVDTSTPGMESGDDSPKDELSTANEAIIIAQQCIHLNNSSPDYEEALSPSLNVVEGADHVIATESIPHTTPSVPDALNVVDALLQLKEKEVPPTISMEDGQVGAQSPGDAPATASTKPNDDKMMFVCSDADSDHVLKATELVLQNHIEAVASDVVTSTSSCNPVTAMNIHTVGHNGSDASVSTGDSGDVHVHDDESTTCTTPSCHEDVQILAPLYIQIIPSDAATHQLQSSQPLASSVKECPNKQVSYSSSTRGTASSRTTTTTSSKSNNAYFPLDVEIKAPAVRNMWSILMAVQGGLLVLKAVSEGCGINKM